MGRLGIEMDILSEGSGYGAMQFDTVTKAVVVPGLGEAADKLGCRANEVVLIYFLDIIRR
jgi:hypothetical protein